MVQHPGVVRVFDYGQLPSGEAYLAMEFLEGDSLRQRINRYLRISEADTMRLGRQIASAVAAAHAKQIVHRDLKPDNKIAAAAPEDFRPQAARPPEERLRTGYRFVDSRWRHSA